MSSQPFVIGNAGYLSRYFTSLALSSIQAYREGVLRYVLPGFDAIEKDAERLARDTYNNGTWNENADPSEIAEMAYYRGIEFSEMMPPVRQTMLNLMTAGLFHHVEQQLAHISRDRLFASDKVRLDTKMGIVQEWYKSQFQLDLETLPSWPVISELRLLANTVKHAEIRQTERLRQLRPQLFDPPALDQVPELNSRRPVSQPLAGEDLFVRTEHFKLYADTAESFCQEIATFFDAHNSHR